LFIWKSEDQYLERAHNPVSQTSGFPVNTTTAAQGTTLPPKHRQGRVLQMFTYAREGLLKPYYLWLTWHFHGGENCPCLCTLGVSQNQVSTSPTDTSIYASNNLPNLMTAIYSTLCTIWKFQVNYSHRISTSQLRMRSVCATCAPVFENLHVHIIPFCTRVVILQCHPKYVF